MELVTVAVIELGQPERGGFQTQVMTDMYTSQTKAVEITDSGEETLKRAVLILAEQRGDPKASLDGLVRAPEYQYRIGNDEIAFHIPRPHYQSSVPFARCKTYPALKVGARYFKLSEIDGVKPA